MFKKFIKEIIESLITSGIVILVIYMTIAVPENVQGASMEPTFYTGERILVEKVTKHFKEYETGEVVVLHPPHDPHISYIKRVIGLPGDVVKIYDCQVYILRDGQKYVLDEPYLMDDTCTSSNGQVKEGRSLKLRENEYLVLGDNRSRSVDSRIFGFISKEDIVGRVVFRFWPLSIAGYIQ
ncbi:signal peptidase I [Patescibacteria group bacterium]